ncbi:MAG: AAA family ATPase [Clostridia bacterium]
MKKIITALGNQVLNNELKKTNEFEIVANDLQYKEAIIELLEINENVNYIILSGILPGNITLTDLITKIKIINNNIEIIILLEKKEKEIEKKLKEQKIKNVLYIDNVKINDIIKILKNKKINNKTKIPQEENIKNEINRKIKINNNIKKQIKTECKVISVLGSNGVGKSIYSVCMSNYLNNKKNKILIIDFDILNNSIHTILGISKYNKKKNNKRIINDCIINVDNNISVLTGENIIKKYKKNINYIVKLLEILKEKYDYIIIDTSAECFFDINKTIINKSDINIFLLEANLLEITKATKLLEIYNKNWNIDERKIKIVINKYNKNAISMNIIKKLFSDYEIIGKLEMSNIYNNIINKNNKIIFKNYKNNNEYKKINEKIIKVDFKNSKIKNLINSYLKR